MNDFKQKLISDIRVKLTEEFDRNFERKAFFDRRWPRRRVEHGKGSLLVVTGTLRRSIRSTTTHDGVRFTSAVPYAAIHNEGGRVPQSVRSHTRRGKGGKRHTVKAHTRHIAMPERRFIGDSPRTRQIIENIIERNISRFSEELARRMKQK